MEIREDGTVVVTVSPDLLEDANKVIKQKKKKKRKSSTSDNTSVLSKHRRLQLAEVSNSTMKRYYK